MPDVGRGDEERVFKRSARFRDLLDDFESHTSRVALRTSGRNGTFVTLASFCEQDDGCTLVWNRLVAWDAIGYVRRTVKLASVWRTRSWGAS